MSAVGRQPLKSTEVLSIGDVLVLDFYANEKFVVGAKFAGGMGEVYQLISVRNGVPFALKSYKPDADRTSFERECETWLSLSSHPNVAQAFAYGIWNGRPVVLVQWYRQALADAEMGRWKGHEILDFAISLAKVLDFAASKMSVVHQDIKPANILVDEDRQPFLTDFGLARCGLGTRMTCPNSASLTKEMTHTTGTGSIGGTPLYMAPELFVGELPGVETDVYSFGVTLYEALTDEHPYLGNDTGWRFQPRLRFDPLRRVAEKFGKELHPLLDIIVDCVALDPSLRPASFDCIAKQLSTKPSPSKEPNANDLIDVVVAKAAMYRRQKRYDEAAALLQTHLDSNPQNPILMNALGALRFAEGKKSECIATFAKAATIVSLQNGKYRGDLYLDPIINFAEQCRGHGQYPLAAAVLEKAWPWLLSDELHPRRLYWYFEFGWLFLYQGEFSKSTAFLLEALKHKGPSDTALRWITESAWLAHEISDIAHELAVAFVKLRPNDLPTVLCACFVASFVPWHERDALLGLVNDDLATEIKRIELECGIAERGLRPPSGQVVERLFIRYLDETLTGGKHRGIVG